jgi:hypothetical protein
MCTHALALARLLALSLSRGMHTCTSGMDGTIHTYLPIIRAYVPRCMLPEAVD